MKLIVPIETTSLDVAVCPSFGRTPYFLLYDTKTDAHQIISNEATASQGGAGVKAAQTLADTKADAVITFRCGENAAEVLQEADIKLYKAVEGTARENIELCKKGQLSLLTETHPGLHNHGGQ